MFKEKTGWYGAFKIHVLPTGEYFYIPNRITNAGLNLIRNALYGDTVDAEINYIAVGDNNTAVNDADTQLGNEIFRAAVTSRTKTSTGVLDVETFLLDSDGAMTIREIGVFAGGTSSPNTGTMISRVLWSRDKTNLETIKISRTDTIGRG